MINGHCVRLPSELNRQSDESDQSDYSAVTNVLMYLSWLARLRRKYGKTYRFPNSAFRQTGRTDKGRIRSNTDGVNLRPVG
jgi:hypothetical protein